MKPLSGTSGKKSAFPMWTNVKSCSTKPLKGDLNFRLKLQSLDKKIPTCTVCKVDLFHSEPVYTLGNLN